MQLIVESVAVTLFRSVAKATHPNHSRLAAEPGHLPFGIVSMSLLSGLQRGRTINIASQQLYRLFIAQRTQRSRGIAVFLHESCGFFHQA